MTCTRLPCPVRAKIPPAPLWGVSLPDEQQQQWDHLATSTAPPVLLTSFSSVSSCETSAVDVELLLPEEHSRMCISDHLNPVPCTVHSDSRSVDLIYPSWLCCLKSISRSSSRCCKTWKHTQTCHRGHPCQSDCLIIMIFQRRSAGLPAEVTVILGGKADLSLQL